MRIVSAVAAFLAVATPAAADVFVTTTTFEISGSCSTIEEPGLTTNLDLYTIHADAVARSWGSLVFVVNRFLQDNILVLDASNGYAVVTQYSTGNGSNPQDILVLDPGRAYVTRYEESTLWIVHPTTGTKLGEIDLGAFADADGIPEMSQMARVGDRVFVALQNLDRGAGFAPTGTSRLVVLDSTTDTLVDVDPHQPGIDALELPVQNPQWEMEYVPSWNRLVVTCPGEFLALDGGLCAVNPFDYQTEMLLEESQLGGDLLAAVLVSPTLGYALRGDSSFATCLLPFDPQQGTVSPPIRCTSGFWLSDLEVRGDQLFVGDRTPSEPGVRVYQVGTHAPVGGVIDVGLPPLDLEGVTASPVAAPPVVGSDLSAWPNPAVAWSTFRWETSAAEAVLRLYDTRGRLVRRLPARPASGGWQYRWDGTDTAGRPVAAGAYLARVPGQMLRVLRLK